MNKPPVDSAFTKVDPHGKTRRALFQIDGIRNMRRKEEFAYWQQGTKEFEALKAACHSERSEESPPGTDLNLD